LIAKLMDEWRLTHDDLRRADGAPQAAQHKRAKG
jgi:hypothetical protein